jgi:lipopolysaccharide/colanic/teichoic acid biosynthesis glycosyltransferase
MEELSTNFCNRANYGIRSSFFGVLGENFFNLSIATLLLVFLSPVIAITSLTILILTGYPILYRQERVGLNGIPFVLYKFRTMYNGSDPLTPTRVHDKRVTKIGRFIRKYYIDELPQLVYVIKRDMNIIGPRPERPNFVDLFRKNIKGYDDRHTIKPGITGWQQVNISYAFEDVRKKQKLDLYYIKNKSLKFDFKILMLTFATVLSGKGRY